MAFLSTWRSGVLPILLLAAMTSVARAQPGAADSDALLRERVLTAMSRGQRALLSMQNRNGSWTSARWAENDIGLTGLVCLALISSGMPADHEAVVRGIEWLKRSNPDRTYDLSMAIMALAASGDRASLGKIQRMAQVLEGYQQRGPMGGGWGYKGEQGWWDNSNSQFAVLGLREAAYAGVPVDLAVWRRAQDHYLRMQQEARRGPGGAGWGYTPGRHATGSMTVAGIASLTITNSMIPHDENVGPDGSIDCCGSFDNPAQDAIDSGTRWLGTNFRIRANPGEEANWPLYYLYGLERAGRFTGQRFFAEHDWYREGAEFLIQGQSPREGIWKSSTEEEISATSLALLFLSKGLSPVVINKLKFGARDPANNDVLGRDWNRQPRDVNNLVDFTSSLPRWPKLLAWQVVDLHAAASGEGLSALMQSPVQFMSGTARPDAISDREADLLREYLAQGGFLFAVQNCDSTEFDAGFRNLVRRLFDGQHPLRKLPPTHDVYRSEYVFSPDSQPPELWGVDFGCRTAIIYAPFDHACRWNKWMKHDPESRPVALRTQIEKSMMVGVNVIAYATGRELHDKLQTPEPLDLPDNSLENRGRLTIARLRHTGGWDTAPQALRRLQTALEAVNIEAAAQTPTLSASDPALFDYPLIYMHGRKNFQLSETEQERLRQYVENGGFLFADACCGSTQFDESFRQMVEQTFGAPLERIPPTHEIYQLDLGHDIRRVRRRVPIDESSNSRIAMQESIGEPILEGILQDGKYVVVYSKYDLSCALERQATTACAGYPTEDAVKIAVNLVLYGLVQ